MSVTTPLPPVPQTTDPANFSAKADAFLGALAQFQAELDAYAASLSPVGRNMLINGQFQIQSYPTASWADDNYCRDRWYVLTQTGAVAESGIIDPENGYTHAERLTQSQAAAQRFGIAQIVEGTNCKFARGNSGTLSGRIRCSAATPIRYAILGWTGTADIVVSDVVNNWTNATFTAGQFFNSTTMSVLGVGSVTPAANTWTSIPVLTASLGTAFTNLIVMVWTENAQAQNVTLDLDYLQLEAGAAATPVERRPYSTELLNCQRYSWTWTGNGSSAALVCPSQIASNGNYGILFFPAPMRTTPSFSTAGNFGSTNETGSQNQSATAGPVMVNNLLAGVGGSSYSARLYVGCSGISGSFSGYISTYSDTSAYLKFSAEL